MIMDKRLNRLYQNLKAIGEICVRQGVRYAVLCPGSRSAPLAISLMNNASIQHFVINDERSAGYIALGLARQSHSPVVLVSTSGTAAVNFFPAIAEAFFQSVPLIVFTTDRPDYLYYKLENQTIFQKELYRHHVAASYHLRIDTEIEKEVDFNFFVVNKALIESKNHQKPVQINLALDEPLYPESWEDPGDIQVPVLEPIKTSAHIDQAERGVLISEIKRYSKIIIVPGVYEFMPELSKKMNAWAERTGAVVLYNIASNIHSGKNLIKHPDIILKNISSSLRKELQPELIISFGKHIISRAVNEFLRECSAPAHWHISTDTEMVDPYGKLSRWINIPPHEFFQELVLSDKDDPTLPHEQYLHTWQEQDKKAELLWAQKKEKDQHLNYIYHVISILPAGSVLHPGNSLSVRLADICGCFHVPQNRVPEIQVNRGTSGIDGVLSTAVGSALASPEKKHVVILGDQSYWYDRNALWNKYRPSNLYIFVLNDGGGKIFERLKGPVRMPHYEDYFVSRVNASIENDARSQHVEYLRVQGIEELMEKKDKIFRSTITRVIELIIE